MTGGAGRPHPRTTPPTPRSRALTVFRSGYWPGRGPVRIQETLTLAILATLTLAAEVVEVVQVECPDRGPAVAPLLDVVRLPGHGLHVVVADPLLGGRAVGVGAPLSGATLLRPAFLHWNDTM